MKKLLIIPLMLSSACVTSPVIDPNLAKVTAAIAAETAAQLHCPHTAVGISLFLTARVAFDVSLTTSLSAETRVVIDEMRARTNAVCNITL